MFYNTIAQTGQLLLEFRERSERQEDIVLEIFTQQRSKLTPFDVQKIAEAKGYSWPITSIRRAITQLTNNGKLRKLEAMKKEMYGTPNHYWIVN